MHTGNHQEVTSELFLAASNNQEMGLAVGGQVAEDFAHNLHKDEDVDAAQLSKKDFSRHSMSSIEIEDLSSHLISKVPDMWSKHYIGLYSQYAAVGLLYGSSGTLLPFCVYNFNGATNVCANARNIVFFAWSFKICFAILTDSYRPFGYRRKAWMVMGWSIVLILLLVLAIMADQMDTSTWLVTLLFSQCFLMLSDVPADGYSVELGQLESKEQRGQILATGMFMSETNVLSVLHDKYFFQYRPTSSFYILHCCWYHSNISIERSFNK